MIIVCGTDFSEASRSAESTAGALATLSDAEVWFVHVLDPATRMLAAGAQEAVEASAQKRLEETLDRLKQQVGKRGHPIVLTGPASEAIQQFAAAKKADLIIVASQGHGASRLSRVGGISERLAQSADRPVLVARSSGPFEAWSRRERRLRLLLAVDWTRSSDSAIRWASMLRQLAPCDVVVGYVYYTGSSGEGSTRYGLRPASVVDPDPETERLLARDLASRIGDLGGTGEISFRPKHGLGRLGDHLLELADSERVDLIVLGTHHKRGLERLGSVAGVTLHFSHSAVAVVPLPEAEMSRTDEVPCIRRVVVPTDLSPLANSAVGYAYAVLTDRAGEVYLLHVAPEKDGAADADIAAQLRALVPTRGVPGGITTRTEIVRHHDPSQAIRETAERLGADAICMGSHGSTGLRRAVLGSIAESVMRESRCPVFIVRALPP